MSSHLRYLRMQAFYYQYARTMAFASLDATLTPMETLRGVVERITYHSEESGYTVAKMTPELQAQTHFSQANEVTLVGNLPAIQVGELVEVRGEWKMHAEYGRQFAVEQLRSILPATMAGIERYLGSGMIRGVGPAMAKRIVDEFGEETLDVIEQSPERLLDVPGIGRKRVQMVRKAWEEQRAIKEVMLFLQSNGVSSNLATKIYKQYGDNAIGIVQTNPYQLARDVYGIGFLTADRIAQSLGIPSDSPQRIAAGITYALSEATNEGHVYLPSQELLIKAADLLHVSPEQSALGLSLLLAEDALVLTQEPGQPVNPAELQAASASAPRLISEYGQLYATSSVDSARQIMELDYSVYLRPLYFSEQGVAGQVRRLLKSGPGRLEAFRAGADWPKLLAQLSATTGLRLAQEQLHAAQIALTSRIAILTGGPGTGKTTTVRSILQLCKQAGYRTLLAAPTGRAAKRLAEATGQEARTIHRLLEFQPSEGFTFKRNSEYPLNADLLVVDEASMLDTVLTNQLLKAVPSGTHVLLVGDVDQLPSVGAGNVLHDLIDAFETVQDNNAQVVRLKQIFRQLHNSLIITNAHRINGGAMPDLSNAESADFFMFSTDDANRAAELCVELVTERIPRRFAIPPSDIQVLSPMHRSVTGVTALNARIQETLNPQRPGIAQKQAGNRIFRVGDRVMQIRNNYEKEVYNGDIGVVSAIDLELQRLSVLIDTVHVEYSFLELDELIHAYAISVHKSQGSEFPAVVVPMMTNHYMMLQRNLLYTAVTRAKRLVVLVGQQKAVAIAVRNNKVAERYTGLKECILAA